MKLRPASIAASGPRATLRQLAPSLFSLLAIGVLGSVVRAALPSGWNATRLGQAGYLDVTLYPNVRRDDPAFDSHAGIQTAIDDAKSNGLAVYFPSGTYWVGDTLRCYSFNPPGNFVLIGSRVGPRPVIKLMANATGFSGGTLANGLATRVKPMLAIRSFINGTAVPDYSQHNPFDDIPGWTAWAVWTMRGMVRNLDFDCNGANGNAGAVGVSFPAAQDTALMDVRVIATGAYAGFIGTPGDGGGSSNLEVVGGAYGIKTGPYNYGYVAPGANAVSGGKSGGAQGLYGVTLTNQTVAALDLRGAWTTVVVGFDIARNTPGPVLITPDHNTTGTPDGACTLIDGRIAVPAGSIAIDNTGGKNIYVRNVYFAGSDALVQSGGHTLTLASPGWKLLPEYYCRDAHAEDGLPATGELWGNFHATSYTLIDGTLDASSTTPGYTAPMAVDAPPATLVSNHIPVVPSIEDTASGSRSDTYFGDAVDVTKIADPAVPNDGQDDLDAIHRAIAAADAAGGPGRVFLPAGVYDITGTIHVTANTKLFGVGNYLSVIRAAAAWTPTAGNPTMLDTPDRADATTSLSCLQLAVRTDVSGGADYNRFNHILWRAGKASLIAAISVANTRYVKTTLNHNPAVPRRLLTVTGHGGGRVYFLSAENYMRGLADSRCILVADTTGQPLGLYSMNTEPAKYDANSPFDSGVHYPDANIEFNRAPNIRLYTSKREGIAATLLIRGGCRNIAFFGFDMRPYSPTNAASVQVLGAVGANNTGILGATLMPDHVYAGQAGRAIFQEVFAGVAATTIYHPARDPALAPDGAITVFKRGVLDDTVMNFVGVAPPQLLAAPVGVAGIADGRAVFTVAAAGEGLAYQWRRDGMPLAGATAPALVFTGLTAAQAGNYDVLVSNAGGQIASVPAALAVAPLPTNGLVNLSIRTNLTAGQDFIVGLVTAGGAKRLLLRMIGPGLAAFGLSNGLADPRLALFDGAAQVAENDDWGGGLELRAAFAATGAFSLPADSRDAALLTTAVGGRTAQMRARTAGTALVEIYDADTGTPARLVNLSARGRIGPGQDGLIAGFVVGGTGTRQLLIRAVGPRLGSAPYHVAEILPDPNLVLFDHAGRRMAENDDWITAVTPAVFSALGAFALDGDTKSAALLATLSAGQAYTVQVSDVDGRTGEALVEIFEL